MSDQRFWTLPENERVFQLMTDRGLPAGDYYVRLSALGNGTATGVYSLFWEERV